MPKLRGDNYIRHAGKPDWGLGKIIYADGADVWVYFKHKPGAVPEDRVARFAESMDQLIIVTDVRDPELDNLPPYINGKFDRKSTSLTFERAMVLFQKTYSLGFGDPKYHDLLGERPYKLAAHHRFLQSEVALRDLAQSGTGHVIEQALRIIYFGDKNAETMALNLMHPRWEAPHYFSALQGSVFARQFLKTALAFIPWPDKAAFKEYASAIEIMQWKGKESRTGLWPLLTWLPFVGNPAVHMMIRPSVAMDFASIMPFDLKFESELDFGTYERMLLMSKELLSRIQESELNLSRRPLDMIDLQSFMWVTLKYFDPGALE